MLERGAAMEAVLAAVSSARDGGDGRFVAVSGEAGIGKTTLLRHVQAALEPELTVLWGACDSLSTPRPLGPLVDIARDLDGELAALLDAGSPRERVYSATLRLLTGDPKVVFIEDAHWADQATIDLLTFLRRRLATTSAVVVTTFRDDEVAASHPLRSALAGPAAAGELRIRLEPLSVEAVQTLAGRDHDSAAQLHALTGGNPFFVTELLAGSGSEMPRTVRDAVLARTGDLSPAARAVLETVAVIPLRAETWLVAELLDQAEDVEGIDECVREGIVVPTDEGVAFRHELARLAVRDSVTPVRRGTLHRRALHALGEPPTGVVDETRLAHHAFEAGDADAVLRWAPEAATIATARGAHRQAVIHLDHALRYAGGLPEAERADLWRRAGVERHTTGDAAGALEAFDRSAALARLTGDPAREGVTLIQRTSALVSLGRQTEAVAGLAAALNLLEPLGPSPELASAYSAKASDHMLAREFDEAESWGRRALELAESLDRPDLLCSTLVQTGIALLMSGDDEGMTRLRRGQAIAADLGRDDVVSLAYSQLGSGGGEVRRYDLAVPALEAGRAYARERDLLAGWTYQTAWLGRCLVELGRWSDANDLLQVALASPWIGGISEMVATTALGRLRARRGDPGVWDVLDRALALARENGHLQRLWPVAVVRAEAAWLEGHLETELGPLADAHRLATEVGYAWALGELSEWLLRAGQEPVTTAPAAAPHRLAMAGDHAAAADAWDAIGCSFEAGLALSDSTDPTLVREGLDRFAALGSTPAVKRAGDRLRLLGARVPRGPNAATLGHSSGLTRREVDVLELLVEGLRNADIAQRLTITSKTVDHHVSSVLSKLSVSSRQAAAAKAVQMGWVDLKDGENHR